MNQLGRELKTNKVKQNYQHSGFFYGAIILMIISTIIVGYMIWHYYSYGQWTMDGAFQMLAKNIRTEFLDSFFKTITFIGETIPVIILTLVIVVVLAYKRRIKEAVITAVYMLSVWRLNDFMKELLHRPRPDISLHLTDISSYSGNSQFSMPSGHSMNFMALLLLSLYFVWIFSKNKKLNTGLSAVAIIFGILVGLSRVYLNVHYFSDVVTGWSTAAACAAATIIIHGLLNKRRYTRI